MFLHSSLKECEDQQGNTRKYYDLIVAIGQAEDESANHSQLVNAFRSVKNYHSFNIGTALTARCSGNEA